MARDSTVEEISALINKSTGQMLDHMKTFENVTTTALANLQEDMRETKAQTTKTNGRVTTLEGKVKDNDTADQVFRARIYTAVGILVFMIGTILIPIVSAFISKGSV